MPRFKAKFSVLWGLFVEKHRVLTAPIRVKIIPHLIASHLLFNNITFYCTIQSWHWHKSASRFVPHPRGPKKNPVVFFQ